MFAGWYKYLHTNLTLTDLIIGCRFYQTRTAYFNLRSFIEHFLHHDLLFIDKDGNDY